MGFIRKLTIMNYEQVIAAIKGLSLEDQGRIRQHLKPVTYTLLNVGYSTRIQSNEHLEQMYAQLDGDDFEILSVGGYLSSEPRFDCLLDDSANNEDVFVEHPLARQLWQAKGDRYLDGVVFTGSVNPMALLSAIQEFEHCGCLGAPYKVESVDLDLADGPIQLTIYHFDTESG